MKSIARFLSFKRFWHNIWTYFPVPYVICLIICISFFFLDFLLSGPQYYGVILALTFSTAGSCICRRFHLHGMLVWLLTAAGFASGCIFAESDIAYWLQIASVGVCVIVSYWTPRFYLQILAVPFWFLLCFIATFLFVAITLDLNMPILVLFAAFVFAPFIFLGGLPFGDEKFTSL